MKKEEILFIRAMSVVAALALMILILIFGLGNSLFTGIADGINNNVVDLNQAGSSIYNLYFYKGVNTIYVILFSIALTASVLGVTGIMTKYRGAGLLAKSGALSMIAVGAYTILVYIAQGSKEIHSFIAGFYLDEVSSDIQTAGMMGMLSLVSSIIIVIIGIITVLLIESSRINKMEAYAVKDKSRITSILILAVYSSVYMEWIRPIIINAVCSKNDIVLLANTFIKDYFFAGKWFFNLSYVWFMIIAAVIVLILRNQEKTVNLKNVMYISIGVPIAIVLIRSIIYIINPPRLFGYLTSNELICDTVEAAFETYMLMYLMDAAFLVLLTVLLIISKCDIRKLGIAIVTNIVVSVILIIIAGVTGCNAGDGKYALMLVYAGSALANVAGMATYLLKNIKLNKKKVKK